MNKVGFLIMFLVFIFININIFSETIPFESDRWIIEAKIKKKVEYMGKKGLLLQGGVAYIKDSNFIDGIIEYDVNFSEARGFNGAVWRLQDKDNYEEFYMRAHQSGNPDANQYTPIFNGLAGWQLYHGDGYGAAVKYKFNQWIHVKIVISGKRGEVFIEDMEKPVLAIHEMKRKIKPGKVGIKVNYFAPAYFANFSFKNINKPKLKTPKKGLSKVEPGTIMNWFVSNSFNQKKLKDVKKLSNKEKNGLIWKKLLAEKSGLINLARINKLTKINNTVFARFVVHTDSVSIRKLSFGFSDKVKVYVNGILFYSGNNLYRSRDYRYLGTIGYFDHLYIPLKKGKNKIIFAVSERFGGWGLKAKFENIVGLKFKK